MEKGYAKNVQEIDIKPLEYKTLQQRPEEFKPNQPETTQEIKQKRTQLRTEKLPKISGIILGAAAIALMGVTLGFSQKQNLLNTSSSQLKISSIESNQGKKSIQSGTKLPEPKQINQSTKQLETKSAKSFKTLLSKPKPKTTPVTIADGWIFLGNTNNSSGSTLVEKTLIKGSQTTNSPVVPSVGSIVTVTTGAGVTLRKNKPQKPNFNYKEQKSLALIKSREKLKILQVEYVTPSNTTQPVRKVWAKVDRCGKTCK